MNITTTPTPAQRWANTCEKQGWNDQSKITHLEGFLSEHGLLEKFAAYAEKAAREENGDTDNRGGYTIRVALTSHLTPIQVTALVQALQGSYDDGTAGMFNVDSTGDVTAINFQREMAEDFDVIESGLAQGKLLPGDAESLVASQLALELELHQDESPYLREIVEALRVAGAAPGMVSGLDSSRTALAAMVARHEKAEENINDVVDDVLERAKKYGFTPDADMVHGARRR